MAVETSRNKQKQKKKKQKKFKRSYLARKNDFQF